MPRIMSQTVGSDAQLFFIHEASSLPVDISYVSHFLIIAWMLVEHESIVYTCYNWDDLN